MKNKKICFFISSVFSAGGTERVCIQIASKLALMGFNVSILTMYNGTPFLSVNPDVRLISVCGGNASANFNVAAKLASLRKKLTYLSPDILINLDSALFIYSKVASTGLNIKNIVWEHFNYEAAKNSIVRLLSRRFAAKYSDAIITLSHAESNFWKEKKFCKVPVYTIHNPWPDVQERKPYELTKEQVVLSVGRLTYQKGFDRLLEAWKIVKQTDVHDWRLRIVGSGELKEHLEHMINHMRLRNSVQLIPATPSIDRHYQQAGIFCLASRYEGFPMVLLEAQAFGLPIVSFDCKTGPAEIIKDGENGLLVKNGDCNALAKALILLINSNSKRLSMGNNALQQAFANGIGPIVNQWTGVLNAL